MRLLICITLVIGMILAAQPDPCGCGCLISSELDSALIGECDCVY
jgi:hypothetical protein